MKLTRFIFRTFALALSLSGALAIAAPVAGTVTNKTTGKPAAGDTVVLVDVQAGMQEVAKTTTDAHGRYTLKTPGSSNYLVRVTHQGAGYFIAAPQGGAPGDIPVYDVAAKAQGVSCEADVLEMETDGSQLKVLERFFVHNVSSPPVTQWSQRSFEIVLPPEAVVSSSQGQRPTGLPTGVQLEPNGPKGHYSFNFPIQPDEGEKNTLFLLSYSVPYSGGKFTFKAQESLPTDNLAVLLPMSMTLAGATATDFRSVKEDPGIQTLIAKSVPPGKVVEYTISGTGTIPRDQQPAAGGQQAAGGQEAGATPSGPGGGIGVPINTPDPLSKYKWWILGALALILAAGAAFLLRRPIEAAPAVAASAPPARVQAAPAAPAARGDSLMDALKEEMFALESEKVAGKIKPAEYAEVKAALEVVLRRALKRKS
jgi:hypothetical protein